MPDTSGSNNLEAARTRLETALSTLAQGVASTKSALDAANTITDEKAQMAERLTTLEHENLKLHEQVAAYALKPAAQENTQDQSDKITALVAEKAALASENKRLQDKIEAMIKEKDTLKGELDKTIAELETVMEQV